MVLNNKGFTLVEVLMVVAILAVLSLIMIPNVSTLVRENQKDSYGNLKKSITTAARTYVSENKYKLGISCSKNQKEVTLEYLVSNGYLSSPVIDPLSKNEIDLINNSVLITYDCNTKEFTYQLEGEFDWQKEE